MVSILIMLDSALEVESFIRRDILIREVSILIMLDSALEEWIAGLQGLKSRVSILIMLDSALEVPLACSYSRKDCSFNPNYAG